MSPEEVKEVRHELFRKVKLNVYYALKQKKDKFFSIRDSSYVVRFKEEILVELDPESDNDPRSQNVDLAPYFKKIWMSDNIKRVH